LKISIYYSFNPVTCKATVHRYRLMAGNTGSTSSNYATRAIMSVAF